MPAGKVNAEILPGGIVIFVSCLSGQTRNRRRIDDMIAEMGRKCNILNVEKVTKM